MESFTFHLYNTAMVKRTAKSLLHWCVGCVCPSLRLQHRALSLLQPDRSVPAPAEHLHQQQQHIRRHVYNYREPRRAGERGGKTREAPTSPSPCSAPKQTLKVGGVTQSYFIVLRLTARAKMEYSLNAKYNVTEYIRKKRSIYISTQEKEGLCGEPSHVGGRHSNRCRWYRGEDCSESELCGCQQQWRCVEKQFGCITFLAPLTPLSHLFTLNTDKILILQYYSLQAFTSLKLIILSLFLSQTAT